MHHPAGIRRDPNLACGGHISGCNSPVLVIGPVTESDTAFHHCVIGNACDATVNPPSSLTRASRRALLSSSRPRIVSPVEHLCHQPEVVAAEAVGSLQPSWAL